MDRVPASALLAVAMAMLLGMKAAAEEATTAPDVRGEPVVSVAEPRHDLVDVRLTTWQRIEVHPDGRTLDVYCRNGRADCRGLDRIEVTGAPTGLDIAVYVGRVPDTACRDIALPYVTTLEFDEPLSTGGGL